LYHDIFLLPQMRVAAKPDSTAPRVSAYKHADHLRLLAFSLMKFPAKLVSRRQLWYFAAPDLIAGA